MIHNDNLEESRAVIATTDSDRLLIGHLVGSGVHADEPLMIVEMLDGKAPRKASAGEMADALDALAERLREAKCGCETCNGCGAEADDVFAGYRGGWICNRCGDGECAPPEPHPSLTDAERNPSMVGR